MPMTVMNNNAAAMALGELNKNINKLGKELTKISSGRKVNSSQDDASGFAIAAKMRAHIRALAQDIQNSQTGAALVKTASGGIDDIVDELRNLKELALKAADDHNTDADRTVIQKDFDNKKANIDDIASTTNYNGIPLLDGRWKRQGVIIEEDVKNNLNTETKKNIENPEGDEGDADLEIDVTDYTPVSKPTRPSSVTPTIIPVGDYTIIRDGVYKLASGYTGKITIDAENVEIGTVESKQLDNVFFECKKENTNLWLNNINAINHAVSFTKPKTDLSEYNASFIRFGSGKNNTLNLIGEAIFQSYGEDDGNIEWNKAVINVGGGLTIFDEDGTGRLNIFRDYHPTQRLDYSFPDKPEIIGAMIGSDANEISYANIVINSGNLHLHGQKATAIGSGSNGSIGNIFINGGNVVADTTTTFEDREIKSGAAIGSGYMGIVEGSIVINGGTVKADSDTRTPGSTAIGVPLGEFHIYASGAGIGAGTNGIVKGKIIIRGGQVYSAAGYGAAIGTGSTFDNGNTSVERIFINGGEVHAYSEFGDAIGTGSEWKGYNPNVIINPVGKVGSITVKGGRFSYPVNNDNDPPIRFYRSVYDRIVIEPSGEDESDFVVSEKTIPKEIEEKVEEEPIREKTKKILYDDPLIIHTGPKANQNLQIYINDMRIRSLKGKIPNEADIEHLAHLSPEKAKEYQEMLDKAKDMSIEDVSVHNRENANLAIRVIEGALDYALDEATTVGAYIYRLNTTESNLVTAKESSEFSESTISDADMAKEVTEYTKFNILNQASQAMLAQANKSSAMVLSLLQ